jgi:16S rRNA (guanine(966)-N(2))-methyltransferase RsmD
LFLDLFAGSGAVGIEALSRGARRAVFVENNRKAVGIIQENLENTGFSEAADVFAVDVIRALGLLESKPDVFDIVFLGAPYDSPDLERALQKLGGSSIIGRSSLVIAEHRKQHGIGDQYGDLKVVREARYGETVLKFYENSDLSR